MAAAASQKRVYCSVYGCLNSSIMKPTLSFFQLPADAERRSEWLRLISREDLTHKTPQFYKVCEEHFCEQDILPGVQRKKLKKKVLPTLNLPDFQKKDAATQTAEVCHVTRACQSDGVKTEITISSHNTTQTTQALLLGSPLMRKLRSEIIECRKTIKSHEISTKSAKFQKETLHKLCDNLLSKQLAMIVKANVNLKVHSRGNRYEQDYLRFCLNLHDTSPEAYRLLQSVLCMPCPTRLRKITSTEANHPEMVICENENSSDSEMTITCKTENSDESETVLPCKTENSDESETVLPCKTENSNDTEEMFTCTPDNSNDSETVITCKTENTNDSEKNITCKTENTSDSETITTCDMENSKFIIQY